MKTKKERLEGERNDLYVYNEGHKKGFQEGRTQTLAEELEFLKSVICDFEDCDCWNCSKIRKRIKPLSKLEDDEVKDD